MKQADNQHGNDKHRKYDDDNLDGHVEDIMHGWNLHLLSSTFHTYLKLKV
jgi:hypothetical protein